MAQPVVHVEIIGRDPARLRAYYTELFGWDFATGGPVSAAVSEAGNYGFTAETSNGTGVMGGVGGGSGYQPHALFYVGVPDVEAAEGRRGTPPGGRRRRGAAGPPAGRSGP